jgi:pyridoxal phosphate enzyme (YggS family)
MREVGRDDLVWHFIGRLQSYKTRAVAESFDWVHTIDRAKIAERLSRQRPYHAPDLNACIQVNIDAEEGKSGAAPEDVPKLAAAIAGLPKIRLRGLMCIPRVREGFAAQREPFRRMRELREALADAGIELDTLSMGMSDDFAAAIHEGATIVRIGTALFGPRDPQ